MRLALLRCYVVTTLLSEPLSRKLAVLAANTASRMVAVHSKPSAWLLNEPQISLSVS